MSQPTQPGTFLQFSIRTILAVIFMFVVALAVFVPFVGQTIWLVPTMKKIALSEHGGPGFGLWSSVGMFAPMMMGLVYPVTLTWWKITPSTLEVRENGIGIGGLWFCEWSAIFGCQWRDGKHAAILTLWYPSALWNTVRRKVAMMPLEAREPVQRLLETKDIQPMAKAQRCDDRPAEESDLPTDTRSDTTAIKGESQS